jgi:hypothetical protein
MTNKKKGSTYKISQHPPVHLSDNDESEDNNDLETQKLLHSNKVGLFELTEEYSFWQYS